MIRYPIDADKFFLYLKTIQPSSNLFTFQTFSDSKATTKALKDAKQRDPLAITFTATAEDALPRLQTLQERGAGIFVQMNVSSGRGKDNVTKLSSYFLDTDGAPVAPIIKAMPKPLMVVESSKGNYHIYWRTTDPLQSFKATQKSLAQSFECDVAMVNLDRVVRIPGTWHLKYEDKPFQVGITLGEDKLYTAQELLALAPAPVAKTATNMSATDAMITTGEGFEMPEVLKSGDRTHYLISYAGLLVNQGFGADECMKRIKAKMLELLPAGDDPIPDETLEIEVYPSVHNFIERDNRPEPADEPLPIAPADDLPAPPGDWGSEVTEPVPGELKSLEAFIDTFYYIEIGSRIISINDGRIKNDYKLEEFKNSFGNCKRGKIQFTKKWLECEERKTVRDIIYHPAKPLVYDYQGSPVVNNYEGNELKTIETPHPAQIQVFLDHMDYMFPNQEDAHVFFSWMATTIKYPERRVPWAPFIVSAQGVGKGWLGEVLKELVGLKNFAAIGPKDIKDGFNEFMYEKTVLVIDELKTNGRDQFDLVETLKPMITEPHVAVNIKFGVKGTFPTYVNVICFSNHTNALPMDDGDRRFWVHRVLAAAKPASYYDDAYQWLKTDGPAHLYQWLKNYDIGQLNMNASPAMTVAKREMINSFKSEIENILTDAIEDRVGPFIAAVVSRDVMESFVADAMGNDKLSYADKNQIKMYRLNKCAEIEGRDKRVRVDYGNDTKTRKYPVIVRDHTTWVTAPQADVVAEMKRAWQASLGQMPGANLNAVESNDERM